MIYNIGEFFFTSRLPVDVLIIIILWCNIFNLWKNEWLCYTDDVMTLPITQMSHLEPTSKPLRYKNPGSSLHPLMWNLADRKLQLQRTGPVVGSDLLQPHPQSAGSRQRKKMLQACKNKHTAACASVSREPRETTTPVGAASVVAFSVLIAWPWKQAALIHVCISHVNLTACQ